MTMLKGSFKKDCSQTVHKVTKIGDVSHDTCHAILHDDLYIYHVEFRVIETL
jgi:hypothetical protein